MTTGQFPKRRETDEEAEQRKEEVRLRNLKQGYDKDVNLIGEEKTQIEMHSRKANEGRGFA